MGAFIPDRKQNALTGSEFVKANLHIVGSEKADNKREANILKEGLEGNIPEFLKKFVGVEAKYHEHKITYLVMPDVFSIGINDDFVRIPMNPLTAKKIADQYNCVMPTKKMCDQIWKAATIKLSPIPKGPPYDTSMLSTETLSWHNEKINKQLKAINKPLSELITGHKKDVVIDQSLLKKKDKVAIYGWFYPDGKAIQGPTVNSSSHSCFYVDYSHSIRLIAQDVIVNSKLMNFYDVLDDPDLAPLISEQGHYDARSIYS